jgi:hypothetical protein
MKVVGGNPVAMTLGIDVVLVPSCMEGWRAGYIPASSSFFSSFFLLCIKWYMDHYLCLSYGMLRIMY